MKKVFFVFSTLIALGFAANCQDVQVRYNNDIKRYCLTNTRDNSRAGNIELGDNFQRVASYEGTWYYVVRGLNNMYGVIASSDFNRWMVESQYTDIHFLGSFSDFGLFCVKKKGSWGIVDQTGKVLIPCQYQSCAYNDQNVTFTPWEGKNFMLRYHDIVNGNFQLP